MRSAEPVQTAATHYLKCRAKGCAGSRRTGGQAEPALVFIITIIIRARALGREHEEKAMTTLNSMKKKRRPLQAAPFRESLHDSLTDQLRNMILKHELQPGEWLQEMQLCETLGVSRTPMREALKVLASEKLVVLHPYRGASVAEIELEVVAELFEVQAILESQAGLLAAERASDAEISAFSAKQDEMTGYFRAGDRSAYFRLNQELHTAIVTMAANTRLLESHQSVMTQISHARYAALDEENRWQVSIEQHAAIRDALVRRDGPALAARILKHVNDTKTAIIRGLERGAAAAVG